MNLKEIKKVFNKALPPTVLSLLLLFINIKYFGANNILISTYMTLTFIRMRTYLIIEKNIFKPLFIHLGIGVLASLASIGVWSGAFINFFGVTILVYLLTDDYNPGSYFPYLMAFVLLQIFPTTVSEIPKRLIAIGVSYLIVYIFLIVLSPKGDRTKIYSLIESGFNNIQLQFEDLNKGEINNIKTRQLELFDICRDLNRFVYSGGQNKYYQIIVAFQHINNLILDFISSKSMLNDNKKELEKMCSLFKNLKKDFKNPEKSKDDIYIFKESMKFTNKNFSYYVNSVLEYLCEAIIHANFNRFNLVKLLDFRSSKEYFQVYSKYDLKLNEFKLRFAIRMAIILTLSFFTIRVFNLPKGYWLPMTVFLLALPFYEDSKERVKDRFYGTVIGLILAFVLFSIFKGHEMHIFIVVISTFLMYSFKKYGTMSIYITCYAMAITTFSMRDGEAIMLRLLYTVLAVLIVLFANRFILQNKNHVELLNMIKRLLDLDKIIVSKIHNVLNGEFDQYEIRRIVYSSYLISGRIEMHNISNNEEERKDIKMLMLANSEFIISVVNYAIVLHSGINDELDYEYINSGLKIIDERLKCFNDNFLVLKDNIGEKCDNIQLIKHEENYKNYCLIKCIDRTYEVEKRLNIIENL